MKLPQDAIRRLGDGVPSDPIQAGVRAMDETRPGGESRERRRDEADAEVETRMVGYMQDPPAYVDASIGLTMVILGGDLELAGGIAKAAEVP